MDEDDPNGAPHFNLLTFDYLPLSRRVSVAAHRARFRRSIWDDMRGIMNDQCKGVHVYGPRPAPSMAVRSVVNGTCEISDIDPLLCRLQSEVACIPRRLVAVVDRQVIGDEELILLWI